jgi:hypothetical protein
MQRPVGDKGPRGLPNPAGDEGSCGTQGERGPQGPAGISCTLVDIGNGTGKITCRDITLHVVLASITDLAPEAAPAAEGE